jgi:ADP-ribose pyrophosphatase YjhB (NUDIX family)
MHKYQSSILKRLLYNKGVRFSDLNKLRITSDRFTFHLKKLIEKGLVVKKDNLYYLSAQGKELTNRLEKQAKLGIALNIIRDGKNGRSYLVQKRSKEPFVGWYGTPSGKIKFGENPNDTAKRTLKEEIGLIGDIKLSGVAHHIRKFSNGTILEDEYFWVFIVTNVKGNLMKHPKGGMNIWVDEKEFKQLTNVFATYSEMEQFTNSKDFLYVDIKKTVKEY